MAASIAGLGPQVMSLVLPYFLEYAIGRFGWPWGLTFFGANALQICVFSMFFWWPDPGDDARGAGNSHKYHRNAGFFSCVAKHSVLQCINILCNRSEKISIFAYI